MLISLSPPSVIRLESVSGGSWSSTHDTLARIRGLAVFAECLAVGLACGDRADVREAVAH